MSSPLALSAPRKHLAIDTTCQNLATNFPTLCERTVIGQSHENRDISCLKIPKAAAPGRPVALIVAGTHGREMAPPDAVLNFVQALLEAYKASAGITYGAMTVETAGTTVAHPAWTILAADVKTIVDKVELYVVPLLNPDGRDFDITNPGSGDPAHPGRGPGWRKNRRPEAKAEEVGVDLNRNFDIAWKFEDYYDMAVYRKRYAGDPASKRKDPASDDKTQDDYRGDHSASEPETQALQKLVNAHDVRLFIDVHMFGPDIMFCWGLEENGSGPTMTWRNDATFLRKRDGLIAADAAAAGVTPDYKEFCPPAVATQLQKLAADMRTEIIQSGGGNPASAADPLTKASDYTAHVQSAFFDLPRNRGPMPGGTDDYTFSRQFTNTDHGPTFSFTMECGRTAEGGFHPPYKAASSANPNRVHYPKIEREVHAALKSALVGIASMPPPPPKPTGAVRKHTTSAIEIQTTGILLAGTGEHEVHVLGAFAEVPAPLPPTMKEDLTPLPDEATRDRYLSGDLHGTQEDPDAQPFNPQVPAFFVTRAGEPLFLERDWSGIELASLTIPDIPDVAPAANGGGGRGGGGGGGGGGTTALPVPLFPAAAANPLLPNAAFQAALDAAADPIEKRLKVAKGGLAVRFAFAEVTDQAKPFPFAGYGADQMDYIASEAKVEVMYAAFAVRDMAQRFADATGATSLADLVSKLTAQMNPPIRAAVPEIASATNITNAHRDPGYTSKGGRLDIDMLSATPRATGGLDVGFTPAFKTALEGMIVPSNNDSAGSCVHGVGYGYMNGVLAAGGFFDRTVIPAPGAGLWEAGDYHMEKVWPAVRIPASGGGTFAQLGTAMHMAKLVSLIFTKRLLNTTYCGEMLDLLAKAAKGVDIPWVLRPTPPILKAASLTHNKIGLGDDPSGPRSEVSVFQGLVDAGRRYVVAWQNLRNLTPISLDDVARVILNTITTWEATPPPPAPTP